MLNSFLLLSLQDPIGISKGLCQFVRLLVECNVFMGNRMSAGTYFLWKETKQKKANPRLNIPVTTRYAKQGYQSLR